MTEIKVVPLGAGQDVGRSCILVSMGGRNIMLDCGMHMGYQDDRRFPDFSYIAGDGRRLTEYIDCLIISHFHLDHCGALPYMSEMVGYDGPIYMTYPTKAICPVLLEDYRKITVDRKGERESNFFTSQMIKDCMKKCIAVNLHETVEVPNCPNLRIKAYYAGHVLGAAMFWIQAGSQTVVYTGDFNMTPDRHLGAAQIDRCEPDLLISESTYATTIRDSKRARERDFLKKVHDCVDRGGKVLIPVFALGRAQELCILLESYWEQMNLKVPIYFTAGLAEKATAYYKLFISWTNEKIKKTFVQRNMFDFKHIQAFDKSFADQPGAMVVFATPGMLHSGQSLEIFRKWAPTENNMIIMPGYCVHGTVGHKVISGAKRIELGRSSFEVKLAVEYMSFSAHADAKGIMQLIRNCQPRNVLFVHGEDEKMKFLKEKVEKEFAVPVFKPANGETVVIKNDAHIVVDASVELIKRSLDLDPLPSKRHCPFRGTLLMNGNDLRVVTPAQAVAELMLKPQMVSFTSVVKVKFRGSTLDLMRRLHDTFARKFPEVSSVIREDSLRLTVGDVVVKLTNSIGADVKPLEDGGDKKTLEVSWNLKDDGLGSRVLRLLESDALVT